MLRLIKIEGYKIYYHSASRTFSLLYFGLMILVAFVITRFKMDIGGQEVSPVAQGVFSFPQIWNFVTYFASWFKFFLAIVLVTTITDEFTYGTLKQNLIDSLTKKEYILSKVMTIFIFSVFSTFIVLGICLFFGLMYSEQKSFDLILKEIYFLPLYFIDITTFFSLCLLLSFWVRSSAMTFALIFVLWIVEKIVGMGFQYTSFESLKEYLPFSAIAHLIEFPLNRTQTAQMLFGASEVVKIPYNYALVCLGYCVLFIGLTYQKLRTMDL